MKYLVMVAFFAMCSCTFMKKNTSSNELEKLSEDVLKSKEGIEIDVKPILKAQ